jgi:hypothetical protein
MTFAGCSSDTNSSITEGVIENIIILPNDCGYSPIFIEFKDGRIVRFLCSYTQNLSIQKGAKNRIYHDGVYFNRSEVVE